MGLPVPIRADVHSSSKHPKRWGYEIWIENCDEYCGKVLHFVKGGATSMHFHKNKLETMFISYGKVKIEFLDTRDASQSEVILAPGDSIQIPRLQPHRIAALEDSNVIEFSTTHEDEDSYRVVK